MFYIAITVAMLVVALAVKGLSATETIVIFAFVAPITYYLVRVAYRVMEIRAMRAQITDDTP